MSQQQTPDPSFMVAIRRVAYELQRCADDVLNTNPVPSRVRGHLDHVAAAEMVIRQLARTFANLNTAELVHVAVVADHPSERWTPGQLLDRATTAVAELLADKPQLVPEEIAEAALRGVGVLGWRGRTD